MRKLLELNKEWFDKSNELFADFLNKGSKAHGETISSNTLKRDVHLAMSTLMLHVMDGRLKFISDKNASTDTIDAKYLDSFNEEIRNIYNQFEESRDYSSGGLLESSIEMFSKNMSKFSFELIAKKEVYSVQKLMEEFWSAFFSMKKSGDTTKDDARLEELLSQFNSDINSALAA